MAKKILLIDDDVDMGKIISFRLKSKGYELEIAQSGKEAKEKIGSHPQLILLDVYLPDISGLELAKEIPESIPIIFLTGKAALKKGDLPQRSNIAVVIKPCDFVELIGKIEHLCSS